MRYLVLTDIHANLEALDACLADAAARRCEGTLILGDIVGYGPNPNDVIERVQALAPAAIVRGNHDRVACGLETPEGFNIVARHAALWTAEVLTADHRQWLAALPRGPVEVDDLIEICHGSPFDEDVYVFDDRTAAAALEAASRPLCLFGHTHYATAFELAEGRVRAIPYSASGEETIPLHEGVRYLINPGAVGQPRDGDPRAAYAIVDTNRRQVTLFRLSYPIEITQAKVLEAGLPEMLAKRLAVGR
jgi:diadenosine tetraphosphatase ApaH/serine/threonine PP2A family protein phosphatase